MTYTLQTATQEWQGLTEEKLDQLCESLVIQGYKLLNEDTNIVEGDEYMGDNAPLAVYYTEAGQQEEDFEPSDDKRFDNMDGVIYEEV